jgi:deoxyribodipyrimidine photo-lyase
LHTVPSLRIQILNDAPVNPHGNFILYWMIAYRRTTWNFSLDEAVNWARSLNKPLLIFEALRVGYPWASDRLHRFIIDGMADNAARLEKSYVTYYPYVELVPGEGKGLLYALASQACLVVTDLFPNFFLPRMEASAALKIPVRLIQVDANGLLPLRSAGQAFPTAHGFRRFIQKKIRDHVTIFPKADPFFEIKLSMLPSLPASVTQKWPKATQRILKGAADVFANLPINHSVKVVNTRGGPTAATLRWRKFLGKGLSHYPELRNEPEAEGTSGLSPYLHFGHISPHQIFEELMGAEDWSTRNLPDKATGSRGWWGVGEGAEMFLDQLITWRELGYNMCFQRKDYDQYRCLPPWAQKTLGDHAQDPRRYLYTLAQFESGMTHDPLWNAAQRQLVREGRLHNYLRMLWGKKILEWSASPQEALTIMIELNNKYALDGRDPNSYSGIFWTLGRYDRPWGPERPIFGKIRYMSSENTARKIRVQNFIKQYPPE